MSAWRPATRRCGGLTTNPTIFASALAKGGRYDHQLRGLAEQRASVDAAVFAITTDDVRAACDILAPVYDRTAGRDGRVSIEIDPRLAGDTGATVAAARALRSAVERENMFVKVPATLPGLAAIRQVTSEGISVNVTLIFGLTRYREVMDAYLVNTMPGATLKTFADHGQVAGDTISGRYEQAQHLLDQLAAVGLDFDDVTSQLERDGVAKFEKSWAELSATVGSELHHSHDARP